MDRIAVFVDAGYLYAAGSQVINKGVKLTRPEMTISPTAFVAVIEKLIKRTADLPLLRIYWYDGVRGTAAKNPEHFKLAETDGIKLRLGFVNSQGQQKGVDSLIVMDLVEIARNKAATDAIVIAGDGDLSIGVQVAQSFGMRVHIVGLKANSMSPHLKAEADTIKELTATEVNEFLTKNTIPTASVSVITTVTLPAGVTPLNSQEIEACVKKVADTIPAVSLATIDLAVKSLPNNYDGKLLGTAKSEFCRLLTSVERQTLRSAFRKELEVRKKGLPIS